MWCSLEKASCQFVQILAELRPIHIRDLFGCFLSRGFDFSFNKLRDWPRLWFGLWWSGRNIGVNPAKFRSNVGGALPFKSICGPCMSECLIKHSKKFSRYSPTNLLSSERTSARWHNNSIRFLDLS